MHKSKLCYFLILLFSPFYSFSQGFEASLLVGANFSQVDGDQMGGYNKLGLNSGIAISREFKTDFKWSFELLYSQKGSKKVIDPEDPNPVSLKLSYHYVEVPLLIRYQWTDFSFYGGPSFGINVFKERDDNGIVSDEDELLRTELALHLGGTYYINENFGFDLRHSYSLLTIRDAPLVVNGPTWFGRAGWFNRLFTVGIRYNLGS